MSEPLAIPTPPQPSARPRVRRSIIGPLFAWELIRLARRGQDARARSILAVVLLLVLFLFVLFWFPDATFEELMFGGQQSIKIEDSSRFAEQFSFTLLLAQLAVMVLLTPAYAAGSIAEEKERKTFHYLLVSDLTNRELVLGKFLARSLFLLGVMFAGLPILALTGLVGGIDPLFLVGAYILTAGTVMVTAACSMTAAVFAGTFRGAMFRAYGMTALYAVFGCVHPLLSPFAIMAALYIERSGSVRFFAFTLGGYLAGQLVFTITALVIATYRVRGRPIGKPRQAPEHRKSSVRLIAEDELIPEETPAGETTPPAPVAKRVRENPPKPQRRRYRDRPYSPERAAANRPMVFENDPFYWKELYSVGQKRTDDEESIRSVMQLFGFIVVFTLALFSLISFGMALTNPIGGGDDAAKVLLLVGTAAVFAHLLTLGAAAVQGILRERQQNTLESLLTIPVDRGDILYPKWRMISRRGWWWGLPGMLAIIIGLMISRIDVTGLVAVAYLPGVAFLAVSFGLWLSIRCRATARAMMWFLGVLTPLSGIPILFWWMGRAEERVLFAVSLAVLTVAVFAFAWYFWNRACRDFDRDGRE
ncbi:MAG: ABC transporter permease subunit [Gemmataceae bacterium]